MSTGKIPPEHREILAAKTELGRILDGEDCKYGARVFNKDGSLVKLFILNEDTTGQFLVEVMEKMLREGGARRHKKTQAVKQEGGYRKRVFEDELSEVENSFTTYNAEHTNSPDPLRFMEFIVDWHTLDELSNRLRGRGMA